MRRGGRARNEGFPSSQRHPTRGMLRLSLHLQTGEKKIKKVFWDGKKLAFKEGAAFPIAGRIPDAMPCRGWAGGRRGGMSRVPTGCFGRARRKHKLFLHPFKCLSPAPGLARSLCKSRGGGKQTPSFLVFTLGLFSLLLLLKLEGSTLADPGERGSPRAAEGGTPGSLEPSVPPLSGDPKDRGSK